jgi:hypothetical protein
MFFGGVTYISVIKDNENPDETKLSYASTVNTKRGKGLVAGIKGCEMPPQTSQF